jgi:hypothetical protein
MPTYTGIIQDQGGAVYDVRAYGAVGNGTTDDTTAIRNAIAAVPEGGTLFIPNGKFRVTDTISINRAISIRGSGPGSAFWLDLNSTTKTGIVIGLLNPVVGVNVSVAENQSYRDFGIFGPTGSCKYGLGLYHCARSRFENIHVRPGAAEHAIVVGGCLYCHFNFVCSNNSEDGYPTGTGLWNGAAMMVADLTTFPGSTTSNMPTNICVFDCTLHGGGGGGLAFYPQPQGGGNNVITGTYEGFPIGTGTVYGSGYGLLIDGCSGFDLRDAHVEATANGSWIKNSALFSVQDTGFFSGPSATEVLKITGSSNFAIRRVGAGALNVGSECSVYEVTTFTGEKYTYSQARKQDSFFVAGSNASQGSIAAGTGMATFASENLLPNGDLSRTPHGFAYAGVSPTIVRTGEGQADTTRRFNRYGLKVSGSLASGFSTRAILSIEMPDSLRYIGQPVTIWADIKRVSGAELGFGVYESTAGRFRTLTAVHQSETEWVRVAANYYPSTAEGAWSIFILPLTDAAYTYYLGAVGALVGVAAPMGSQSPVPSFQNGLQVIGKRIEYGSAAPTTGTWQPGDIVFNAAPSAGGTVGWVCTAAGTPGTWKTFGAISA